MNIIVLLSGYNSYEERLLRDDISITQEFTIQDLIDKNFSNSSFQKIQQDRGQVKFYD